MKTNIGTNKELIEAITNFDFLQSQITISIHGKQEKFKGLFGKQHYEAIKQQQQQPPAPTGSVGGKKERKYTKSDEKLPHKGRLRIIYLSSRGIKYVKDAKTNTFTKYKV